LDEYVPQMQNLPLFMLWLTTEVEWQFEVECFDTVARELADFYCIQPDTQYVITGDKTQSDQPLDKDSALDGGRDHAWVMQHIMLPHMRRNFHPPKSFSNDGSIVQIAQLENLYKIFERC